MLVPVSGSATSERALPVAKDLADRWRLPLRLVSFVTDSSELGFQRRYLGSLATSLRGNDPHKLVDTMVAHADHPASGIVEQWSPWAILVMSTSASVHQHGHFAGSAAETIVRTSGRPVLLVGPACDTSRRFEPSSVVIAVDGSAASEAAIPVGCAWATRFGVPAQITTVVPPGQQDHGPAHAGADSYVNHLLAEHAAETATLSAATIESNDAAAALVDTHGDAALIVTATHSRTGLERVAVGSVAADICRTAPTPVLMYHHAPLQ